MRCKVGRKEGSLRYNEVSLGAFRNKSAADRETATPTYCTRSPRVSIVSSVAALFGLLLLIVSSVCLSEVHAQSLPIKPAQEGCVSDAAQHPLFNDLESNHPQDAEGHYTAGLAMEVAGDDARAETELRTAVQMAPGTNRYVRALGLFYIERGRRTEALAVIRSYAALCGPNGLGYGLEAELLFQEKHFDAALAAAAKSLSYDKKNARMHELVGLICLSRLDDTDGVVQLSKAEQLAPQDPEVRYFYGRALYSKGHYAEARDQFLACLQIKPGYRKAGENLALSYEALHDFANATKAFQEAIKIEEAQSGPKHGEPFGFYGAMLIEQGKSEDAFAVLRKGEDLAPDSFVVNFELGKVLIDLDQLDEAQRVLLTASNQAPGFARTYYLLGTLSRKQNNMAKAKEYFAKFQELNKSTQDQEFPLTER